MSTPATQRTSQFLLLGATVVMFVLQFLTSQGYFGPNPVGSTSTTTDPLLIPPGWAFAIWGPIYLGLLIFPIYQLIKNRDNHPAWVELRYWLSANAVANGVWLVLASYDYQWATVAVIVVLLATLFRVNQLLVRITEDEAVYSYWLERLVLSLYFGWVTLATVLNVTSALAFYGWDGWGIAPETWTVIMLVTAAAIAGITARHFVDPAYALVPVWAFTALAVRHLGGTEVRPAIGWTAVVAAVAFLVLAGYLWRYRQRAALGGGEGNVPF